MAALMSQLVQRAASVRQFQRVLLNTTIPLIHNQRHASLQTRKRRKGVTKPVARKSRPTEPIRVGAPVKEIPDPVEGTEERLAQLRKNEKIVLMFALVSVVFVAVSYKFIFTEQQGKKIQRVNEERRKALAARKEMAMAEESGQ